MGLLNLTFQFRVEGPKALGIKILPDFENRLSLSLCVKLT